MINKTADYHVTSSAADSLSATDNSSAADDLSAADRRSALDPAFLLLSHQAMPAANASASLKRRNQDCPRQSGLPTPTDRSLYHQNRFNSRGTEALTPGANVRVDLLPLYRKQDGRYHLTPRAFATTTNEMLYSPSFSACEAYAFTYLLNHIDYKHLNESGYLRVSTVRLSDLAACKAWSVSKASRVVHSLQHKGKLRIHRMGHMKPNTYHLSMYETGAATYPAGHPGSARARIQSRINDTQNRRVSPATRQATTDDITGWLKVVGSQFKALTHTEIREHIFHRLSARAQNWRAEHEKRRDRYIADNLSATDDPSADDVDSAVTTNVDQIRATINSLLSLVLLVTSLTLLAATPLSSPQQGVATLINKSTTTTSPTLFRPQLSHTKTTSKATTDAFIFALPDSQNQQLQPTPTTPPSRCGKPSRCFITPANHDLHQRTNLIS
jgi:hypothetical protein